MQTDAFELMVQGSEFPRARRKPGLPGIGRPAAGDGGADVQPAGVRRAGRQSAAFARRRPGGAEPRLRLRRRRNGQSAAMIQAVVGPSEGDAGARLASAGAGRDPRQSGRPSPTSRSNANAFRDSGIQSAAAAMLARRRFQAARSDNAAMQALQSGSGRVQGARRQRRVVQGPGRPARRRLPRDVKALRTAAQLAAQCRHFEQALSGASGQLERLQPAAPASRRRWRRSPGTRRPSRRSPGIRRPWRRSSPMPAVRPVRRTASAFAQFAAKAPRKDPRFANSAAAFQKLASDASAMTALSNDPQAVLPSSANAVAFGESRQQRARC